jgi:hypothetical protein
VRITQARGIAIKNGLPLWWKMGTTTSGQPEAIGTSGGGRRLYVAQSSTSAPASSGLVCIARPAPEVCKERTEPSTDRRTLALNGRETVLICRRAWGEKSEEEGRPKVV